MFRIFGAMEFGLRPLPLILLLIVGGCSPASGDLIKDRILRMQVALQGRADNELMDREARAEIARAEQESMDPDAVDDGELAELKAVASAMEDGEPGEAGGSSEARQTPPAREMQRPPPPRPTAGARE